MARTPPPEPALTFGDSIGTVSATGITHTRARRFIHANDAVTLLPLIQQLGLECFGVLLVLIALCQETEDDGFAVTISREDLGTLVNRNRKSLTGYLDRLVEHGFITRQHRIRDGVVGSYTVITLTDKIQHSAINTDAVYTLNDKIQQRTATISSGEKSTGTNCPPAFAGSAPQKNTGRNLPGSKSDTHENDDLLQTSMDGTNSPATLVAQLAALRMYDAQKLADTVDNDFLAAALTYVMDPANNVIKPGAMLRTLIKQMTIPQGPQAPRGSPTPAPTIPVHHQQSDTETLENLDTLIARVEAGLAELDPSLAATLREQAASHTRRLAGTLTPQRLQRLQLVHLAERLAEVRVHPQRRDELESALVDDDDPDALAAVIDPPARNQQRRLGSIG